MAEQERYEQLLRDKIRVDLERDKARAEVERLREALERYGVHETGCAWLKSEATDEDQDCDCGLREALNGKESQ